VDLGVKNSVAFITGGGEGIGRIVATMLAQEGASIALADREPAALEETAKEVRALGAKALTFQLDVTNKEQVAAAVQKTVDEFKKIDILAHIPGRGERKVFVETTKEDWDFSVNLNLYGVLNSAKAVVGQMVKQGSGSMVFVVSDAGKVGEASNCVYSAAKGGVIAFSKALARDLGRHKIRINCVALSAMRTPGGMKRLENRAKELGLDQAELEKKMLSNYLIRRFGEPQDAANAICFLVSNRASWITGQTLSVNGGYSMV